MKRILIAAVAFAGLVLCAATAEAQSWMFQPGTYTQTDGPKAQKSAVGPHAYATFTESQAVQAAKIPKPAFRWDGQFLRNPRESSSERLRCYLLGTRI